MRQFRNTCRGLENLGKIWLPKIDANLLSQNYPDDRHIGIICEEFFFKCRVVKVTYSALKEIAEY